MFGKLQGPVQANLLVCARVLNLGNALSGSPTNWQSPATRGIATFRQPSTSCRRKRCRSWADKEQPGKTPSTLGEVSRQRLCTRRYHTSGIPTRVTARMYYSWALAKNDWASLWCAGSLEHGANFEEASCRSRGTQVLSTQCTAIWARQKVIGQRYGTLGNSIRMWIVWRKQWEPSKSFKGATAVRLQWGQDASEPGLYLANCN